MSDPTKKDPDGGGIIIIYGQNSNGSNGDPNNVALSSAKAALTTLQNYPSPESADFITALTTSIEEAEAPAA